MGNRTPKYFVVAARMFDGSLHVVSGPRRLIPILFVFWYYCILWCWTPEVNREVNYLTIKKSKHEKTT
jgi:hypothetical protein